MVLHLCLLKFQFLSVLNLSVHEIPVHPLTHFELSATFGRLVQKRRRMQYFSGSISVRNLVVPSCESADERAHLQ